MKFNHHFYKSFDFYSGLLFSIICFGDLVQDIHKPNWLVLALDFIFLLVALVCLSQGLFSKKA